MPGSHPAIASVRDVAKRYPPKQLWGRIAEAIGEGPDQLRLQACYDTWRERKYNPTNYDWAMDWYVNGIPGMAGAYGKASNAEILDEWDTTYDRWRRSPEEARAYLEDDHTGPSYPGMESPV